MKTLKTIGLFFLVYTLYTFFVVSVTDYRVVHALTGIVFIWIAFGFFAIGYLSTKGYYYCKTDSISRFPLSRISEWKLSKCMAVLAFSWFCSIAAVKFYTGRSFLSVIHGLRGSSSSYYIYQNYFANNKLGVLSITKIPFVLMLAFLTVIMMWSVLAIMLSDEKKRWWQWLYLFSVVLAYLFFGIARGTNFETYIVFILFSFCLLNIMNGAKGRKKLRYLLIVFGLGICMVFVFRFVVMSRGFVFANDICPEIHFKKDSSVAVLFPAVTSIGLSVFSYLGYGIYAIGVAFVDVVFKSLRTCIAVLLPLGFKVICGSSLNELLRSTIDLQTRWVPDYIQLIDSFGLPLLLVLFFFLGRAMARVSKSNCPKLLKNVMEAIVYIEMLSIPVGNFLVISSSNKLMILFAILWLFCFKYTHSGFISTERNEM